MDNRSTSAGIFLRFYDEDGELIEEFTSDNLPIPNEGEEILLTNITFKEFEGEEMDDDIEMNSFGSYEITEISKQYSKVSVENPDGELEIENSPSIIVDIYTKELGYSDDSADDNIEG
ncbi:hypothetical protein [Halopiger xanaduensis]|uniref:Uncharacterized protein n=1 Tax=Halopiger xanaduensis (strain DSM 18323 / JCM 14033 / SH-6) TaxID=797210 RepID=F8DBY4_HALXS|nr:hypothetical protein [Halopiger xanaduensis]AEH35960.1 hypothetical protein Halxa_1327 [Halopiger xanaduensis SH-6]